MTKIIELYYEMLVDAIEAINNSDNGNSRCQKTLDLITYFSVAQSFNFILIVLIVNSFIKFDMFIHLDIFPGDYLDRALSGMISLFFPFVIINYFMLFHKLRYKRYVKGRRVKSKGKVFAYYFTFSSIVYLMVLILGKYFYG